jgi:hypothetical protein
MCCRDEPADRFDADTRTQEDVVAMPMFKAPRQSSARRGRPAGPHCRGGASSVLRLSQVGAPRLPTAQDLAGWIQRAGSALNGGVAA